MRWAGHLLSQLLPRTRDTIRMAEWLGAARIGKKFLMQRLKITGPP